jgi:hypothetical protein
MFVTMTSTSWYVTRELPEDVQDFLARLAERSTIFGTFRYARFESTDRVKEPCDSSFRGDRNPPNQFVLLSLPRHSTAKVDGRWAVLITRVVASH